MACSSIELMGMYDEIRCEYPLPPSGYRVLPGHTFQTKSFECMGDQYTITADGRLIAYRKRSWLRPAPEGEELACCGDISFYDVVDVRGGAERVWIQYKARFTDGRLSGIEVEDIHDLPQYNNVAWVGEGVQVERDPDE